MKDPRDRHITPADFGDVDVRDRKPIRGDEKRPSPPAPNLDKGPHGGATPRIPTNSGDVGGGLEGDMRTPVDGYEIGSPENETEGKAPREVRRLGESARVDRPSRDHP